jgi:hypothetical protein
MATNLGAIRARFGVIQTNFGLVEQLLRENNINDPTITSKLGESSTSLNEAIEIFGLRHLRDGAEEEGSTEREVLEQKAKDLGVTNISKKNMEELAQDIAEKRSSDPGSD